MGIKDVMLNFSARRVDDVLSSLLLRVPTGAQADKIKTLLKGTQDLVRRSF